jgi:hypothetical protein
MIEDPKSAWVFTVKILVQNLMRHDEPAEPDPATIAMELIKDENGFAGVCDFPDDYQIINLQPYSDAIWDPKAGLHR